MGPRAASEGRTTPVHSPSSACKKGGKLLRMRTSCNRYPIPFSFSPRNPCVPSESQLAALWWLVVVSGVRGRPSNDDDDSGYVDSRHIRPPPRHLPNPLLIPPFQEALSETSTRRHPLTKGSSSTGRTGEWTEACFHMCACVGMCERVLMPYARIDTREIGARSHILLPRAKRTKKQKCAQRCCTLVLCASARAEALQKVTHRSAVAPDADGAGESRRSPSDVD